jgi:hypothetical protein
MKKMETINYKYAGVVAAAIISLDLIGYVAPCAVVSIRNGKLKFGVMLGAKVNE